MPRIFLDRIAVTPASIDLNGHVNNQEYVRWMQEVATGHSREQGWPLSRYIETRQTWVIRSHYIEYIRPVFAGEELLVATWVAGIQAQSSPRKYRFVRVRDRKTVVEAETLWFFCDMSTGRPADIPAQVREAFPVVVDEEEVLARLALA